MCASCLTHPRWQQKVFSVGPRDYQWLDVFLAAMVAGAWQPFERQLIEGLACAAAADADADAEWPGDQLVNEAATAFRYDRDLVSSDDTLAWLDRWGLTLETWTDYLVRRLLREQRRGELDALVSAHGQSVTILDGDFAAEGICSDTFDRFARAAAGRAALATLASGGVGAGDAWPIERARLDYACWLDPLDARATGERLAHVARLEAAYQAQARAAVTEAALSSQLRRHRLEWTRVDLERLTFDSADAAREAACCVREDGLTLSEVAIASQHPVRDTRDLLERLEPELRDAVLSASINQLVGPIGVGSRHEVVWVVDKASAGLGDPLVRARAEAAVIEQMQSRAVLAHVRWVVKPRL